MSAKTEKLKRKLADAHDTRLGEMAPRMEALLGRMLVEGLCNHKGATALLKGPLVANPDEAQKMNCRWCASVEEVLRYVTGIKG